MKSNRYGVVTGLVVLSLGILAGDPDRAGAGEITWSFQILHEFSSTDGGPWEPWEMIQTTTGDLYASSGAGGSNNVGTILRFSAASGLSTLVHFGNGNGDYPQGGLIEGADGNFYGTTYQNAGSANGAIFRMTPDGGFTNLHHFDCSKGEGSGPICRLMQAPSGELYGTTFYGGASGCSGNSAGTVFKMTTNGEFSTVVSFNRTNGANPQCGLILGNDGAFYGSTIGGGGTSGDGDGTIFRLTPNGQLTTLHTFDYTVAGSCPSGNLLQASDGNFYGTTEYGIETDFGTIFKMTPGGDLTTLISFNGTNGDYPHGDLIQADDGWIYGRTIGGGRFDGGTIFKLSTNGTFTTILDFDDTNGLGPWPALVLGRDGNLYGATFGGGAGAGGVAFRFVRPPRITGIQCTNNMAALTWMSYPGESYQVEWGTNLETPRWTAFQNRIIATGSNNASSFPLEDRSRAFYRIGLLPWHP